MENMRIDIVERLEKAAESVKINVYAPLVVRRYESGRKKGIKEAVEIVRDWQCETMDSLVICRKQTFFLDLLIENPLLQDDLKEKLEEAKDLFVFLVDTVSKYSDLFDYKQKGGKNDGRQDFYCEHSESR